MIDELTRLGTEGLLLALLLSAPVLAASLLVAAVVGVMSTATQVNEPSLSFVPRVVAVSIVLVVAGGWMGHELVQFTEQVLTSIPEIVP